MDPLKISLVRASKRSLTSNAAAFRSFSSSNAYLQRAKRNIKIPHHIPEEQHRFSQAQTTAHTESNEKSHGSSGKSSYLFNLFYQGIAFGIAGGLTFGILGQIERLQNSQKAASDAAALLNEVELKPPTDSPPFPARIAINRVPFQALATGVRTVTFLNFHVYAVALYISTDDVPQAEKILKTAMLQHEPSTTNTGNDATLETFQHFAQVLDSHEGRRVVDELLRSGVRFAIRIVPTRNTDFPHLRDGFVRSIMNQDEAKRLQSAEFGQSVNEIKKAFGRKRKLLKGEVVTWSSEVSGGMSAWYGPDDEDKELLGSPSSADVARLFFLQYMTGSKPNSPTLKENAVRSLALLAT